MENEPIIVEQEFNASPSRVWEAITQRDEMVQWFFDNIPNFIPAIGFYTEFDVVAETRTFPHQWRVTEVTPEKKLVYNWKFEGYEGSSDSCFELFPSGAGTLLKLTATVLEPFDQSIPEFKRESGVAGWNYFIKERLKDYLDGE